MPTGVKKHCEGTKLESHQTAKMLFFSSSYSEGLVQSCVTLSQWFSQKNSSILYGWVSQHIAFSQL